MLDVGAPRISAGYAGVSTAVSIGQRARPTDNISNVGTVPLLRQLRFPGRPRSFLAESVDVFDLGLTSVDVHAQEIIVARCRFLAPDLPG